MLCLSGAQVADTWDKCIENTLRKVSYGTLAGALFSLVLFRARGALQRGIGAYAATRTLVAPSLLGACLGVTAARRARARRRHDEPLLRAFLRHGHRSRHRIHRVPQRV